MSKQQIYTVAEGLDIQVTLTENPFQIEPTALFRMAARINKKRNFLFVSPVLGKHLPVNPAIPLLVGRALALIYGDCYQEQQAVIRETLNQIDAPFNFNQADLPQINLSKPVTIIGFCETATALGQAFFESFASPATYIHTTREQLGEDIAPLLSFEEEHSHATAHKVYASDPSFFQHTNEIILVDDEVTTGKTNLNIIRDIVRAFPHKKIFSIISILDWRNESHQQAVRDLEQELEITIKEYALLKGLVTEIGQPTSLTEESLVTAADLTSQLQPTLIEQQNLWNFPKIQLGSANDVAVNLPYLEATGRFGINNQQNYVILEKIERLGNYLQEIRTAGNCLVLGTGEFMYLPMRIASFMGEQVFFHATTRSPILSRSLPNYPIFNKRSFSGIEQPGARNFVYTIPENHYQDIFVMLERILDKTGLMELNQQLATCKATNLYFLDFSTNTLYRSQNY
ncbi:phosphoribosyltransferase family protein [Carnobacterium gallinarum]|uniref:phosphoribosyltransferase family protein n=1 Tax=Carnobacterium gallinarum TaxID=2749 RepID=UPI00055702BE|nr:phosphoribosyltransferase family protein [Carnobacterium gallinarum]